MNNDAIRWHTFERDIIPEVLIDSEQTRRLGRFAIEPYGLADSGVAVGYAESRTGAEYNPPCLLVLGNESAVETLSWLKVYAPETFPLSQYLRVVSEQDWAMFNNANSRRHHSREDVWASVILGEALAQGETEVELTSLPLSRASACFSMAIARAACTFGTDDATKTCADRLRQVETDRRFVRRAVSVNDLLPIWAVAGGILGEPVSADSAVNLVIDAALKFLPESTRSSLLSTPLNLRDVPGLSSDSIEERVLAFQRLSNDLAHLDVRGAKGGHPSVLLAAAAFLVGRSTSHEFLLRRVSKQFPTAPVWYGLIAALAGPSAWDASWSKAAKGIERQVRPRFDWSEAPGFDLCWIEYSWMASTFDGFEAFNMLPKLLPRVLSIEIVPGSSCQFRLATGTAADVDTRQNVDNARERELQATLSQVVTLANHARHLLERVQVPTQHSLDFEDGGSALPRSSKGKKGRGSSYKG